MRLDLIILALHLIGIFSKQCSNNHASNFELFISSKRNETGHWIVQMRAGREDRRAVTVLKPSREMSVNIGHGTEHCGDSESSTLLATITVASAKVPPAGYEMVNGMGYYKMYPTAMTWDEGREKCAQDGAHVIVLNSDNEADVIRTFMSRKPSNIPNVNSQHYTFVGLHDQNDEGKFVTLLGEPVETSGYNRWGNSEPNGGKGENCVMVKREVKYEDITCDWKTFIICELYDQ